MQQPPPVTELLQEMNSFADDVQDALTARGVDWHCCPQEGEWSLTEVACHLRDVEREVHQPRFRALIEADGAFLAGAVADDWVEQRRYREQHGPTALGEFLEARRETLEMLRALPAPVWQRKGQHSFFGPTSMHELLFLAVQHDRAHWEQIQKLLAM
ncbi:MAG: DinB family protein [Chloroflexota bacterium]